jgi:TonB family protein
MRIKLAVVCVAFSVALIGDLAGKADAPPPYKADIGRRPTPWGVLHSFDQMRPDKTVPPVYPVAELNSGATGRVVVAILVGEEGAATDAQVLVSSGIRRFDESALTAVKKWKYKPLIPRERFVTIQPIAFTHN